MTIKEKIYTAEEFWDFTQLPESDDKCWELIDGVIIQHEYNTPQQSFISARLVFYLFTYLDKYDKNLGYIFPASICCRLNDYLVLAPNLCFISKTRMPDLEGDIAPPPELAVEVVTNNEDVFRKVQYYLSHSTLEVWAIYDYNKSIFVFTKTAQNQLQVQQYDKMDTIRTSILPNLELKLDEIFGNDTA